METTCSFHGPLPLPLPLPLISPHSFPRNSSYHNFSTFLQTSKHPQNLFLFSNNSTSLHATLKSPKGFGAPKKKNKNNKNLKDVNEDDDDVDDGDENEDDDDEREEGVIPEIVTNRMISRMGLTVGIPLLTGLVFFPLFYYLKVGLKIDVPTWVPFIVSFVFYGTALLGVSYGIVSSSWDPLREGSFWGWTEAQKNWPVFWQSFRGGGGGGGSRSSKK